MIDFMNISTQGKTATIDIDGIIGLDNWWDETDEDVVRTKVELKKQLKEIEDLDVDNIIVNINSPGGDVNHGISMHDILKQHSAKITTKIEGLTASIATIIGQAADDKERMMSKNAMYLVHNVSGLVAGNSNTIERIGNFMKKLNNTIASMYAANSNRTASAHMKDMDNEDGNGVWMTAEEARKKGYIDQVYSPKTEAIKNLEDLTFLNIKLPDMNTKEENTTLISEIKTMFTDFMTTFNKKKDDSPEDFKPETVFNELKTGLETKITDLETANSDLQNANEKHVDDITGFKKTIGENKTEINTLTEKIAKLEGKDFKQDKTPDKVDDDGAEHFLDEAATMMRGQLGYK